MGLETVTNGYPSELNASNPTGSDGRYQGDNHIRILKQVAKATLQRMPGVEAITELTISSGSITPTTGMHTVDTEADAAEDDLTDIDDANFLPGALLLISSNTSTRDIIVKNGSGNHKIQTISGEDTEIENPASWMLLRLGGSGQWYEVGMLGRFAQFSDLRIATMDGAYWPAFKVYKSANQTISSNPTEVTWDTEVYDKGSNFASNGFTAPVAGVYRFTFRLNCSDNEGFAVKVDGTTVDVFNKSSGLEDFSVVVELELAAGEVVTLDCTEAAATVHGGNPASDTSTSVWSGSRIY